MLLRSNAKNRSNPATLTALIFYEMGPKNGAVNLSALRKFAMELLKKQNDKLSLKRRRKKCMLNLDYLAKVVNEG